MYLRAGGGDYIGEAMGLVVGWPRRRMGQHMVGEVGARGLSLFGGQTLQLWRRSLDAWRVRLFYQKSIYLSPCWFTSTPPEHALRRAREVKWSVGKPLA